MVILAATIILSLSSNGMLGKANEAKTSTTAASMKEQAVALNAEYELKMSTGEIAPGEISAETYVKNNLRQNGATDEELKLVQVTSEGKVYVHKEPIIPTGFVKSSVSTEDDVLEGMVIYEGTEPVTELNHEPAMKERNQYVWVPVPEMSEFVRRDGYSSGVIQTWVSSRRATEPYSYNSLITEKKDLTGEYAEYAKMKASVEKYGGFYIARYEAGTSVRRTNKANETSVKEDGVIPDILSQKEKYPYNYVGWGPSMTVTSGDVTYSNNNQGIGAVELARSVYSESSNQEVVSTLIYGVQWDAIMNFMKDVENSNVTGKKYIENSTTMGWYNNNYSNETTGNPAHLTGKAVDSNISNMVKNIYDIAGNEWEWTMESQELGMRILRGGFYNSTGIQFPASYRYALNPQNAASNYGFRVALYLK